MSLAQRKGQPLSFLMLDLDRFKSINDKYGHHIGDLALKFLSEVIKKTIRGSDIFGRVGGEEFALVFDEDVHGAMDMAERLRQEIENIIVATPQGELNFTASIGLAQLKEYDTVDSMLKKADVALYSAKEAGRNRVFSLEDQA